MQPQAFNQIAYRDLHLILHALRTHDTVDFTHFNCGRFGGGGGGGSFFMANWFNIVVPMVAIYVDPLSM